MNDINSHRQEGEDLIIKASYKESILTDRDSLIARTSAYYECMNDRCRQWIDTFNLQTGGGVEEGLAGIFTNHLPLFLTDEDYISLDSLTQPARIRSTLAANKRVLLSPASVVYKTMVAADPIGLSRN